MKPAILIISIILNLLFLIGGILFIQKLGGFSYLKYRLENRGLTEVYEHRKQLFEKMTLPDSAIVFLGNSITAQCEWSELFQNPKIYNRGIPGDHAKGILKRLGGILKSKPEKIFLMVGVNDLLFKNDEEFLENFEMIVKQVLNESPNTQLFIQSILPVNNLVRNTTISNENIIQINDKLNQIALNNQLPFLDLYPRFVDQEGNLDAAFTLDGIHLNGEAYLVWKSAIEKYVLSSEF